MVAKDVSVGLTYECLVSDKLVPVKLTRECEWGGWYGTNVATGHKVRIKTAGRLRKQLDGENAALEAAQQDIEIHTTTKEAAVPASTKSTDAKTARAARRAKSTAAKTVDANPDAPSMSDIEAKPPVTVTVAKNVTPRNAKGQIMSKKSTPKENTVPSAVKKSTAKPAAAKTAAKKPAAKRGSVKLNKSIANEAATLTQTQVDAMVAAAVAAAIAEVTGTDQVKLAAKRSSRKAPVAKPVVITLAPTEAKVNSFAFKYAGKNDNPLVTAVYVMVPLLERFAADGSPVEIAFTEYKPTGKQKPQPKSKIRYSGSEDTIRDLYVDRAGITALGYSEDNAPVVTVKVIAGNKITLTFSPVA